MPSKTNSVNRIQDKPARASVPFWMVTMFITTVTVFWFILAVSAIHVMEEYAAGWVKWVNRSATPISGITMGQFYVVNGIFIFLCTLAVIINTVFPIYSLSIAALLFINAIIHIGGTIKFKGYTPGVASAIILYVPFSLCAYYLYAQAELLTLMTFVLSLALGGLWMTLAVAFALVHNRHPRKPKK